MILRGFPLPSLKQVPHEKHPQDSEIHGTRIQVIHPLQSCWQLQSGTQLQLPGQELDIKMVGVRCLI